MRLASATIACAVVMCVVNVPASYAPLPQPNPGLNDVTVACATPTYRPALVDDKIKRLLGGRRQVQLVIGASEFVLTPESNRPFVSTTAKLISGRLRELGYTPIQSLSGQPEEYLVGKAATKERVRAAIEELALEVGPSDVGVLYYVGHGSIAPNRRDLSLAVFNRPVEPDEGIRVSDIVSTLSLKRYPSDTEEIPKFIIVLETCYSGNAVNKGTVAVASTEGFKVLADVNTGMAPAPPKQMVVISATAAGDQSRAFDLKNSGLSAFGFFFARAFKEDWACVDTTPDGIITVTELEGYLKRRLDAAFSASLIEQPMRPLARDEQRFSFLAYDASKSVIDGERERILEIIVTPPANTTVVVAADGVEQTCNGQCSTFVSSSYVGDVSIRARENVNMGPASGKLGPFGIEIAPPPPPPPDKVVGIKPQTLGKFRSLKLENGVSVLIK